MKEEIIDKIKEIIAFIVVFGTILILPFVLAIHLTNNFKNNCKKENGILIKGTREDICVTKEQLNEMLEEIK